MPNYKVTITRKEYTTKIFEVNADNEVQAEDFAFDEAVNTFWLCGNAEYKIDEIEIAEES